MKQLFVLGRNPKLSREEIFAYLESRNIKFKEDFFDENFLCLECNYSFEIQDFGGVLRIGQVEFEGNEKDLENYIFSQDLVPKDKFFFAMFGNTDSDLLKTVFKQNKQKAMQKFGRKKITFQDGSTEYLPKAEYYFFLHNFKNTFYFAKLKKGYDSTDVEFRDMNKPFRREELAISPRLAKILINLSGAKEKDFLLDPFCGVGGILQEALIKNIDVYGSDIDNKAIQDGVKNLKWIKKQYKLNSSFELEKQSVFDLFNQRFDAVATETPLGELVTKRPDDRKAKEMIEKFQRFIIPALNSIKQTKKQNAKIAITFPKIRNFQVDLNHVLNETNLKIKFPPIEESHKDQFIIREVLVFY